MKSSNINFFNSNDNGGSKRSVVGLSTLIFTALASLFVLNSCASDPTPTEDFSLIPEPLTIPTPVEATDTILPDPIENQDFNNPPEVSNPAVVVTPTAKHVPGRPGFVFNPYTQNMVDVDGIPSGTKVKDPQDSDENHTFYVP